jgi:hypothetical protein
MSELSCQVQFGHRFPTKCGTGPARFSTPSQPAQLTDAITRLLVGPVPSRPTGRFGLHKTSNLIRTCHTYKRREKREELHRIILPRQRHHDGSGAPILFGNFSDTYSIPKWWLSQ